MSRTGGTPGLDAVDDAAGPAGLLAHAWAMEPDLRLAERAASLDRLEALLAAGDTGPAPAGRDWRLELLAERAIDAAAYMRLRDGQALAEQVLAEAAPDAGIARARATLARGRALAWIGTEEATREGDLALADAAAQFRALGAREWEGFTVFWRGHAVRFQLGDLPGAAELMTEALAILAPDSPRRWSILTFYADVLTELGRLTEAAGVLAEASEAATRRGLDRTIAYAAWSRARLMASREQPAATLAALQETEAHAGDWFATMTGLDFLADAAVQLDRVGEDAAARRYLERARDRVGEDGAVADDGSPFDEPLRQAEAMLLARSGDPGAALTGLQAVIRGAWLEKRLLWRNRLLYAWATLRAGDREAAAHLAAEAFAVALAVGGPEVAPAGEPLLSRALAPLAAEAGSAPARALLADPGRPLLRLFGAPEVRLADGVTLSLPAGRPSELLRWLAISPEGLAVPRVLTALFPDADPTTARQRLRQILTRLRGAGADLVRRDGELLRLAPAWVDWEAFRHWHAAAGRARGSRRIQLAWAARVLADRGPLLLTHPYADWAQDVREQAESGAAELGAMTDRRCPV